jgi:hypothetical protein
MKKLSHDDIRILLGQYLDGALADEERRHVEQMLSADDSLRREFEQLQRMKQLLAESRKTEPNIGFWTRLSTHLEKSPDEENLLPFPRKYVPVAAISGVLGILLIGAVIFQNRMSLFHFVSEKSQMVQSVYEDGILKGSILPLFAHVNDNQALQFSLTGVLPLDAKAETSLRVDQDPSKGYQIKLGKAPKKKSAPLTVNEFYAEIDANRLQRKAIDSLVGMARRRIETSVLLSENNAVAIDPGLARLNKEMVSNIAACLEPRQRIRFGRFLEKRDAPYTFISKKFVPMNPETLLVEMSRVPRPDKFLVFTADSVAIVHVNVELINRAERRSEIVGKTRGIPQQNFDMTVRLMRRYTDREPRDTNRPSLPPPGFEVWGDANAVNIRFQQGFDVPHLEISPRIVVPMPRQIRVYSVTSPAAAIEFGFSGDSISRTELLMDSAMIRFFNRTNPAEYNLRMMDSIFSMMNSHFQMHPGAFVFDSVFRSLEEAQRKAFEQQRRIHQQMREKEIRVRSNEKSRDDD